MPTVLMTGVRRMKKPLFVLGFAAVPVAIAMLPPDKRQRLARVAQAMAEH
jgi:hypothetical protein